MTIYGYDRVSTDDQNPDLQRDALERRGCDRVFEDYLSGADADRPELEKMLRLAQPGDKVVVWKLDRLGRSLSDLKRIVEGLRDRGIGFESITEAMDTTTPQGELLFHMLGSVAQYELHNIRARTRAGLASARRRGRVGGNPGLRRRDPATLDRLATARRTAHLKRLEEDARMWLPIVRTLRPDVSWEMVARHLNAAQRVAQADNPLIVALPWTVPRLVRAVTTLVDAYDEGLVSIKATADLLGRAPQKPTDETAMRLVAAIARANPALSLRRIGKQMEEQGARTPRGAKVWQVSTVQHLLDRARKRGLLDLRPECLGADPLDLPLVDIMRDGRSTFMRLPLYVATIILWRWQENRKR